MVWKAEKPNLSEKQTNFLKEVVRSRTARQDHIQRAKIILKSSEGKSDSKIAKELKMRRPTVGKWRQRWLDNKAQLTLLDAEEKGIDYKRSVLNILSDAPRPGTPAKFTPEQICQIISVACEAPEDTGLPLSHWSLTSLANELVKRGIVESISTSQLHVFLKSGKDKAA